MRSLTKKKMKWWTSLISEQFIDGSEIHIKKLKKKNTNGEFLYRIWFCFCFFVYFLGEMTDQKKMLPFQNGCTNTCGRGRQLTVISVGAADHFHWPDWRSGAAGQTVCCKRRPQGGAAPSLPCPPAAAHAGTPPALSPRVYMKSVVKTSVYVRTGIFSMRSVYSSVLSAVFESVNQCATLRY